MSDEKKLNDDLNEALDDAKKGAKKAADGAKEAASDFADDAQKVLSDGKNVAIIAHITLIGWVIALVMNNNDKTELGSFYIRQMLGLLILGLVFMFIPVIGWILNLLILVLWIMSLIGALGGEKKPTPVLGEQFQNWFSAL
ncbi:YtxH domain-containing protein [Flavobacteriaceae bacterium GSB9]|nr:YtxH domain-containing protein [Flavobacteriaceae bacterium GSB9]